MRTRLVSLLAVGCLGVTLYGCHQFRAARVPPAQETVLAMGPAIGQVAPEIEGQDLDGTPFKLSDYRGKVVVLDFWGNW